MTMALILEEWVNAAGYTDTFPDASPTKQHYKKYGSSQSLDIAKEIQKIVQQDPLIIIGPNHLRSPLMNPYVLFYADKENLPQTMSDTRVYGHSHISHSLARHDFFDTLSHNDEVTIDPIRNRIKFSDENPLWDRIRNKTFPEFKFALDSIKIKLVGFDEATKSKVAKWLCDTFMTIERDPKTKDFKYTGYFGVAMGIGAEFDVNKIKELISKIPIITPKDVGGNNLEGIKNRIVNSELYRELTKTNRYLAASCMYNEYFNKSDPSRVDKYMQIHGGYIDYLRDLAQLRDHLTTAPNRHDRFMRDVSIMYYNATNVNDKNKYASPKDESYIEKISKAVLNLPYSTQ